MNLTINKRESHWCQRFTGAGASDTFAIFNNKQGAVIGALDHGVAGVEKLVLNPFERNADVRALIAVQVNLALLFNGKHRDAVNRKGFAALFGNILSAG